MSSELDFQLMMDNKSWSRVRRYNRHNQSLSFLLQIEDISLSNLSSWLTKLIGFRLPVKVFTHPIDWHFNFICNRQHEYFPHFSVDTLGFTPFCDICDGIDSVNTCYVILLRFLSNWKLRGLMIWIDTATSWLRSDLYQPAKTFLLTRQSTLM